VISHIRHLIDTHVYYYEQEYRFLKGNGAILFVFDRGYILYDPAGKPYRMIGAMMDVTQRKQTELELAGKESHLRTILTTEPECIKLLNNNGELLEMNPAGLAMIEADSEEQVKGSTLDRLLLDPYKEPFKNLIKKVFQGQSGTLEFEMTGLKGTQRWLETHAVPLKDTAGKIISLLGVTRDVTKRRNAEELLRAAEERFRNIFENATEGIYQSTPEGRFITANSSLARMFGYESASELISSMTHIGLQLYADPSEREYVIDRLAKQDRITGFEMRAFKKNNDIIWVRDHIHAVRDSQGNLLYFEGTLEDITERRNAEDKLKHQFDELQKTNYELDRFVYSVSHDLRAPLSSILGLVMVAELEKPSESHQKYLELIRQSVNRLDGFIHDILDYSRNARTTVTTQKIDWGGLMQAAGENLMQLQGMDRLVIRSTIDDDIPFYSDRVRIEIILNNLLSNAVKYQDSTKDSSTLDVRIDTTLESVNVVFRDNGIGIDKENLKHIFDMFYRASSQSKGSGLGLYITRETVSKLGGTISVKSELGQFTSIEIMIPNLPQSELNN
jgi:PAS domain S-box-containing protein